MLSLVIVGLSITASAVGALAFEVYTSKKVSAMTANLNNRNY